MCICEAHSGSKRTQCFLSGAAELNTVVVATEQVTVETSKRCVPVDALFALGRWWTVCVVARRITTNHQALRAASLSSLQVQTRILRSNGVFPHLQGFHMAFKS